MRKRNADRAGDGQRFFIRELLHENMLQLWRVFLAAGCDNQPADLSCLRR